MIGPIVCDIEGLELTSTEKKRLLNPLVGMVILFTRNYESREQLRRLCDAIHAVKPELLIGVDHEGGRVQRFREAFTAIPAMHAYGALYAKDAKRALKALKAAYFVLAAELRDCGVDFTFAPVLDLDWQKKHDYRREEFCLCPRDSCNTRACGVRGTRTSWHGQLRQTLSRARICRSRQPYHAPGR